MGDGFLVQKLPSCLFNVSNHNLCFAQVITLFFRYAFPLNSDDFSVMAFFLQLHFMLITALLRLILSFIFPWYFPEKSGNICLFFRHVWFNIQWNFVYFFPFELIFELSFFIRLFIRWFIRLFIRIFLYLNFHLLIYLFLICLTSLSCLAFLFIYLFRVPCFLLNCANSVLCAV